MKKSILMTRSGDLDLSAGTYTIIRGADVIRQRWVLRVNKFLGEWVLDSSSGMPYVQEIFERLKDKARIRQIFRQVTNETPGVIQTQSVTIDVLDAATRQFSVSVEGQIEGPDDFLFVYDFNAVEPERVIEDVIGGIVQEEIDINGNFENFSTVGGEPSYNVFDLWDYDNLDNIFRASTEVPNGVASTYSIVEFNGDDGFIASEVSLEPGNYRLTGYHKGDASIELGEAEEVIYSLESTITGWNTFDINFTVEVEDSLRLYFFEAYINVETPIPKTQYDYMNLYQLVPGSGPVIEDEIGNNEVIEDI